MGIGVWMCSFSILCSLLPFFFFFGVCVRLMRLCRLLCFLFSVLSFVLGIKSFQKRSDVIEIIVLLWGSRLGTVR